MAVQVDLNINFTYMAEGPFPRYTNHIYVFATIYSTSQRNFLPRMQSPWPSLLSSDCLLGRVSKIRLLPGGTYGTPEGAFVFQYLPEKKLKQKELEKIKTIISRLNDLSSFLFKY